MTKSQNLGEYLKALRAAAHLSLREVASRSAGISVSREGRVSRSQLLYIETGRTREPRFSKLITLSKIYGISVATLLDFLHPHTKEGGNERVVFIPKGEAFSTKSQAALQAEIEEIRRADPSIRLRVELLRDIRRSDTLARVERILTVGTDQQKTALERMVGIVEDMDRPLPSSTSLENEHSIESTSLRPREKKRDQSTPRRMSARRRGVQRGSRTDET
jgi:transcriptional regulator with XRE-family HTH domain